MSEGKLFIEPSTLQGVTTRSVSHHIIQPRGEASPLHAHCRKEVEIQTIK